MKDETLHEALKEALRFIKAARRLQKASQTRINNPVEQGLCRRASMDLTRKLADLRNNR